MPDPGQMKLLLPGHRATLWLSSSYQIAYHHCISRLGRDYSPTVLWNMAEYRYRFEEK